MALFVLHFDAHGIAEPQEFGLGLAFEDGLDRALFGDAGIADARPVRSGGPARRPRPLLDTVPEPMMVPAARGRVLAAWAISVGKSKVMSVPQSGLPKGFPLRVESRGKWSLRPSHAAPSSSGVTATGERAEDGFDWKKPKPFANSAGIRLRSETSLTRTMSRIASAASSGVAPAGTSLGDDRNLGLEIDAVRLVRGRDRIARAEEAIGAALVDQRIGPEGLRHFRAPGFPDEFDMIHISRAVRPLIGAGQGACAIVLVEAERWDRAMLELFRKVGEARRDALPFVESALQGRHDEEGVRGPREIGGDHHEPAVTPLF